MTLRRFSNILTALAVLAILVGPTWSARVVEVRVGNHPTFTRVVFELDAPAGYRIERREVDGAQELVVELSAASAPRQVKSSSTMVAGVDLEQSGTASVARIRLRGASTRVKEMILGGPPRIVLDVMRPAEVATPAVAPKPEIAASKPDAEAPRVVATNDAPEAAKPDAKPQKPAVAEKAAPPKVAEKPAPAPVAAKPEPPKVADAPKPPAEAAKLAKPPAPKPAAEAPIAQVESALEGERIVQPKVERPDRAEAEAVAPSPAPAPAPVAEAPAPAAQPPAAATPKPVAKAPSAPAPARPAADAKGPFGLPFGVPDGWLPLGLVGAGLLLFLGVVAMLLRRHSKPTSLDALEVAREAGEPVEMGSGGAFETIAGAGRSAAPASTFPVAGPGLFDDEREKGESEMDVVAELPIERGARAGMTPTSIGAGSDLGALVEQLERRMAQLESRLDEANEARERLERQVTAQSEELRVQRAAIARTQRALRGMTRGGEDQATEPALRDPSKPSTGRA